MIYYFFDGKPYWTGFKIIEIVDRDEMLEKVRQFELSHGFLPTVYRGEELKFEPAEIVKSWKIK